MTETPRMRHCWFDFESSEYLQMPGHTCMLPDGHDGPHEPTPDAEIMIGFAEDSA
jgi:hypothetical protein